MHCHRLWSASVVSLCCVVFLGDDEPASEVTNLAKAAEDIGYDDISDDELDDLIEAAEDEQDEKPTDTIGQLLLASSSSS